MIFDDGNHGFFQRDIVYFNPAAEQRFKLNADVEGFERGRRRALC